MSSQPANLTGAINVRYGIEMELAINTIAARHGMRRNQWLIKLAREALDADQEGRPLFQQMEGPRLDTSVNVLAAQLREVLVEWDRIRRENDRRDQQFLKSWNGGEEANRLAFDQLNRKLIEMHTSSYQPFVEKLRAVREEMAGVSETSARTIDARLEPLNEKLEQIRVLAREPRVNKYVVLNKDWIMSLWPMAIAATLMLGIGVMAGLILPGVSDGMAVSQAGHLITSADRMCQLLERQYDAVDCNVPSTVRKLGRGSSLKGAGE